MVSKGIACCVSRQNPAFLTREPITHNIAPGTQAGACRAKPRVIGGDDRVRTDDPLLAKQVLSQLSYAPKGAARRSKQIGPDLDANGTDL